MATAISGNGPIFDAQADEAAPFGGPIGGLVGTIKDTLKGACSGLLGMLGTMHVTGAAASNATPVAGFESLAGLLERLSTGGLAGPVELIGAIVLFLSARRTISRTVGLLAFVGFIAAYANGYELPEMLTILSDALQRAAGVLEQSATVAAG